MTMLELWDTNYYTILSFIHKLGEKIVLFYITLHLFTTL
jgi:hypothetical protein